MSNLHIFYLSTSSFSINSFNLLFFTVQNFSLQKIHQRYEVCGGTSFRTHIYFHFQHFKSIFVLLLIFFSSVWFSRNLVCFLLELFKLTLMHISKYGLVVLVVVCFLDALINVVSFRSTQETYWFFRLFLTTLTKCSKVLFYAQYWVSRRQ